MKKFRFLSAIIGVMILFTACEVNINEGSKKIAMVADTGTVNDKSFNQSAWEGLQEFEKNSGVEVSYVDSAQASDYKTNLEKLTYDGNSLVWGIGNTFADDIYSVANANPNTHYAIADYTYENGVPVKNLTAVGFKSQEPAFLVGYVAGKTTKTNIVGFVGGQNNVIINQFKYGFEAGVKYAAKELNKDITVVSKFADTFMDSAKGKSIALEMYNVQNCDIIFQAAGETGKGVIEEAKELNKFVIGVDRDQSEQAPNNVLTSALKLVGKAVQLISQKFIDEEDIGGKNYIFGIKEGCAGIPETNKNMDPKVYEDTMKIQEKIVSGKIVVPGAESEYKTFVSSI